VKPRMERTLAELGQAFRLLAFRVFNDYVVTHLYSDIRVGGDAVEILDRWNQDEPDVESRMTQDLLAEALDFARLAKRLGDADREILPAPLVIAIDGLDASVRFAMPSGPAPPVRWSVLAILNGVRAFATAFRPYAPDAFIVFEGTSEIPGAERPDQHQGG
jgi:hypothetical protein